jgi:hypothetical protein
MHSIFTTGNQLGIAIAMYTTAGQQHIHKWTHPSFSFSSFLFFIFLILLFSSLFFSFPRIVQIARFGWLADLLLSLWHFRLFLPADLALSGHKQAAGVQADQPGGIGLY